MAWHIFRKDFGLLWPLVALSAMVQLGLDAMMLVADASPDARLLMLIARLVSFAEIIVFAFVIAIATQQEPIPGTRQDWLIRPIRRIDLLVAKLLFVLAAIHAPMLLGDVAEGLAHGFALSDTIAGALSRNLFVLMALSVPAFAIAAMTRTLGQFIGFGLAYFLGMAAATLLLSSAASLGGNEQATNPIAWTGVGWLPQLLGRIALAAGAVVALVLLYTRRRTTLGRALFTGFALASVLLGLLPWNWIFGLQRAIAASPAGIDIAFDLHAPRYAAAVGESSDDYAAGAAQVQLRGRAAGDIDVENKLRHERGDVAVFLPIRFAGLPDAALPWVDRAAVKLSTPSGETVFAGRGDDWKFAGGLGYQVIRMPGLVFERARHQALRLDIDYSLTLLHPDAPATVAALGADRQLPGLGHCASSRDSDGNDIALRCTHPGQAPSCVTVTLADRTTGVRNPETRVCAPDYAPFATRLVPDAINRFEVEAPFRDRLGLAHYPVGEGQLDRADLVLTSYAAAGHFTRRVVASGVRLEDWTAAPR